MKIGEVKATLYTEFNGKRIELGKQVLELFVEDLPEKRTDRVFKDDDGDLWFEITPGLFTHGLTRDVAEDEANSPVIEFARWSEAELRSEYSHLKEVTPK